KAYDVRGRIPDEINESLAYDIGRAFATLVNPRRVAVGNDIRLSSPQLARALKRGLTDCGSDVLDIGLWGTEGSYFATFAERLDGGIMVTASHNPPDYNGMKFVREQARPISADTGLIEMRRLIETGQLPGKAARPGSERGLDIRAAYLQHLLGYVSVPKLRKLKVVVNAGNGGAGLIIDAIEPHLPFEFIKVNNTPTAPSPTACPTRCWRRTAPRPRRWCGARAPTSDWRGTVTTTAASSSTRAASSSRAIIWWACSPRASCARSAAHASCTTRASPGTRSTSCSASAARRCCASPAMPSSSRRCAKWTPPTAAR